MIDEIEKTRASSIHTHKLKKLTKVIKKQTLFGRNKAVFL